MAFLGFLILIVLYWFAWKLYLRYFGPKLPETTPKWIVQPKFWQFALFGLIFMLLLSGKKSSQ